jgi:hypothetical protein
VDVKERGSKAFFIVENFGKKALWGEGKMNKLSAFSYQPSA